LLRQKRRVTDSPHLHQKNTKKGQNIFREPLKKSLGPFSEAP